MAKGKITKGLHVLAESVKKQPKEKQTDAYRFNLMKILREVKRRNKGKEK